MDKRFSKHSEDFVYNIIVYLCTKYSYQIENSQCFQAQL